MSYINSFDETRLIIINGPIARKLESRDATRSRITEPMFTMLESYWVVDSIASRLRVTVSPRIISRNLDVGDIKTLHPPPESRSPPSSISTLCSPTRNKGYSTSMFRVGFSSFKNSNLLNESSNESVQFSIGQFYKIFIRNFWYLAKIHFPNRVFI